MFPTILTLLFAASTVTASPVVRQAADGLNTRAVAAGKQYLGTAVDKSQYNDAAYMKQLANTADFGAITPGNAMKWDATEPARDSFTFTDSDAVADLAKKNGQKLRCHTLVWHSQLPDWGTSYIQSTLIGSMLT